jgi:hypothetical protein
MAALKDHTLSASSERLANVTTRAATANNVKRNRMLWWSWLDDAESDFAESDFAESDFAESDFAESDFAESDVGRYLFGDDNNISYI